MKEEKNKKDIKKEDKKVEKIEKEENKSTAKKVIDTIIDWTVCFIIAYVIYIVVNYFFGTISCIRQTSMFPTAKEGERVTVQRSTIFKKDLNYEDIIIFEAPIDEYVDINSKLESYSAKYTEKHGFDNFVYNFLGFGKKEYIKRVIGLPGDHIEITADGEVYRNEEKIDEKYLQDGFTILGGAFYDVVVPEDHIYVMGDNRSYSKDSRYFGCVPISKVTGYVGIRVWPLNRLGKI